MTPASRSYLDQRRPQPPLLAPVRGRRDGLKQPQVDGITPAFRQRQEEDGLLNVGGQVQEVHDLADAGTADMSQLGQFAIAGQDAVAELSFETQGQGQQPGNPWHAPWRSRRRVRLLAGFQVPGAAPAVAAEVQVALDGQGVAHALFSFCWQPNSSASVLMPEGWKVMETLPLAPSKSTRSTRSCTMRVCSCGASVAQTGSNADSACRTSSSPTIWPPTALICSLISAARCSARRMRSCRSASRGNAATLLPLAAACCTKACTSAFHRASSLSSALRSDANSCTRPVPWAWAAPS